MVMLMVMVNGDGRVNGVGFIFLVLSEVSWGEISIVAGVSWEECVYIHIHVHDLLWAAYLHYNHALIF